MNIFLILFLSLALLASKAFGQIAIESGITHGAELEFSNSWISEMDSIEKRGQLRGREILAAEQLRAVIEKKCVVLGCRLFRLKGKWDIETRVILPSGWWFQISHDPLCVEIQTKPSALQELYEVQPLMEDLIYASAKEVGLFPDSKRATHLNMGARSAFGFDVKSLFNYFVDNANHPEFGSGLFRKNWNTGPPLSALGFDPTRAISEISKNIVSGEITTFSDLAYEIENKLYIHHPNKQFLYYRNQELNFSKLRVLNDKIGSIFKVDDVPIERRAVRALGSFLDFVLHAELAESRVQWVKQQHDFIPYSYKPAKSVKLPEARAMYGQWLQEMNLNPIRYRRLIVMPVSKIKKPTNSCLIYSGRKF